MIRVFVPISALPMSIDIYSFALKSTTMHAK